MSWVGPGTQSETLILLSSGIRVTWVHHLLIEGNFTKKYQDSIYLVYNFWKNFCTVLKDYCYFQIYQWLAKYRRLDLLTKFFTLYCAALYCAAQHHALLHCTELHCTVLHWELNVYFYQLLYLYYDNWRERLKGPVKSRDHEVSERLLWLLPAKLNHRQKIWKRYIR